MDGNTTHLALHAYAFEFCKVLYGPMCRVDAVAGTIFKESYLLNEVNCPKCLTWMYQIASLFSDDAKRIKERILQVEKERKEGTTMEENSRETHATEEEMLLGGEASASRAPRKDRNRDIIERTLALMARAHGLSGEVTYNSATEDPARAAKIDAFKANIDAGLTMGKELMALYKA